MTSTRYVAYYRVSTARQGRSGLGLEAQQQAVRSFLQNESPLCEFVEVESGRRSDRPRLSEALAACRVHRATLVIAKLDRLARNVAFVSHLMDAGVDFIAVDLPAANRLTIHILAAVAEHEARAISERTKAALSAAKKRGRKLGGWRGRAGTAEDLMLARKARIDKALCRANDLRPTIERLRSSGALTLRALASNLNQLNICAPRGGAWSAPQVGRLIKRFDNLGILAEQVFEPADFYPHNQ